MTLARAADAPASANGARVNGADATARPRALSASRLCPPPAAAHSGWRALIRRALIRRALVQRALVRSALARAALARQRALRSFRGRLIMIAGLTTLAAAPAACAPAPGAAARFDYYVLALSWSPTYCAGIGGARREPLQCGGRRGFVVHGLWPQFGGGEARACATHDTGALPPALVRRQLDLIPSVSLIIHEWSAHGACTGLTQSAYFKAVRAMRARIMVPAAYEIAPVPRTTTAAALRAAFAAANRNLAGDDLAIVCKRGRLEEVRICFSKAGTVRACGADVRDRCPQGRISVPGGANDE
jgi:ribonuclease T2